MRMSRTLALSAVFGLLTCSVGAQEPMPMPKPGPEHELLKMDAGVWDASVELTPGPGAPPMTSKGVETNTIGCGGMCLITDFEGEIMPGVAFHGHGTMTWDVPRNKYLGSWTDSMSQGLGMTEGAWDPATRQFKGTMEAPDMTGKVSKSRTLVEYKGESRVMTAYTTGPDGKEMQMMRITYTRKK